MQYILKTYKVYLFPILCIFHFIAITEIKANQQDEVSPYIRPDDFSEPILPQQTLLIKTKAMALSNSTCLPSGFTNAFVFPAYISEKLIQQSQKKLKENQNIMGAEFNAGIEFYFKAPGTRKKTDRFLGISYHNQQITNFSFSRDFFNIVMTGNASYAEKEAKLDKSTGFTLQYESLKFHYLFFTSSKKNHLIQLSPGLARGINYSLFEFKKAILFTPEEGDYLNLELHGRLEESGRSMNRIGNGAVSVGPVIDVGYTFLTEKSKLQLGIHDLGIIFWNKNSMGYARDTNIYFTGINIDNIFNLKESSLVSGDSLLERIKGKNIPSGFSRKLPALLSAKYTYQLSEKYKLEMSLGYRALKDYRPLTECSLLSSFKMGKRHEVGYRVNISYGGWGKFNTGIELVPIKSNHHFLSIGTFFNEGFINPDRWRGNGIHVKYCIQL